jgi:sugar lactone lactonase YvrE
MITEFKKLIALATLSLAPGCFAHEHGHHAEEAPPDALSTTHEVVAGQGENTYKSVPNWCQLPEGRQNLGSTHGGVVVDKKGQIYFSMDGGDHGILIYGPDGKLIKGIGGKRLLGIHGMCLNEENGEEFIYAAHLGAKRAVKLKLDGTEIWAVGVPMESGKYQKPEQYSPTGIAVAPNGDVYVADGYGQNWIHRYDKNQKYVGSFGGRGTADGQFQTCHGIALDKRGGKNLLLVCDRESKRLQHLDLNGTFVAVVATDLRRPCSVSFFGDNVAIAELAGRVAILDGQNKLISALGDNPQTQQRANFNVDPKDWKEGIFNAPHGISYDQDGNLYVMDWNKSGRITRMNKVGEKPQAAAE